MSAPSNTPDPEFLPQHDVAAHDRAGEPDSPAPQFSDPPSEPVAAQYPPNPFPEPAGAHQPAFPPDVPLDLRTPLGGIDLGYLLGFYIVTGAVLTVIVAAFAIYGLHIPSAVLQNSAGSKAVVMIVSQGLLSAATLFFLYVMVRAHTVADFWPSVGWRSFRLAASDPASWTVAVGQCVFGGFALALLVGWISKYFETNTPLPMEDLFQSRQSVLLLMALGILVAPVVEETIFRGCIYPVIARRFGIPVGVIATGTLFGLAHAQQLWGGWGQIALLVCVGIVLTYVRARTGTVAASYLVHLSYNTILFVGFYYATGGLRTFAPALGP